MQQFQIIEADSADQLTDAVNRWCQQKTPKHYHWVVVSPMIATGNPRIDGQFYIGLGLMSKIPNAIQV